MQKNKEGLVGLDGMSSKAGVDDKYRECVFVCVLSGGGVVACCGFI